MSVPVMILGFAASAAACTAEEATPIDPADPPDLTEMTATDGADPDIPELDGGEVDVAELDDVTHSVPPTDQMREAAEAQCEGDSELAQGYVKAVDQTTGAVISEFTIDCDDVR